jgi:lipopolysaccharide/colanic/teichoic acid biosynthesis glycosyltransferase
VQARRAHKPIEMVQLLERERDRTDRSGTPFAMIVFQANDAGTRRDVHSSLLRVLAERLRISDEFGYLDRWRLAVVLPATSPSGAWTVVDDVSLKLPADLPLPQCDVYAYPGEEAGKTPDSDSSDTYELSGAGANGNGEEGGNGSSDHGDRRVVPRVEQQQHAEPALCQGGVLRPVRPLQPLFIRPLPRWKRAVDIVVASIVVIVLSPLLLAIALMVKLTSPGPVLFRQMRSGLGGRPFEFYKFRSMVPDAEAKKADLLALNEQDGPAFKMRRDPRVTPLGFLLRKASLDELPQLWNVLRGDMSLVGPRPLPCSESEACTGWHRRRLEVTPGLTCIWQVEGRSRVSFDDWVRMDIRYMRLCSMMKDAVLMVRTLPAMLLRRGV